jgi:hypothetical protein
MLLIDPALTRPSAYQNTLKSRHTSLQRPHLTAEKLYFEKNDEPAIVLKDGGMSLIAKSVGTEVAGFDVSHEQTAQKVAELAEMGPGVVRTWAWDAKSIGWKFCMVFRRGAEFHMCMPVYRCS